MGLVVGDGDGVTDVAIERLLHAAYVDGGFTKPEVAVHRFRAVDVRARGRLFCAFVDDVFVGMVILVKAGAAACRLAGPKEGEMHLLAVDPTIRARGVGHSLVDALLSAARANGLRRVILWTQPTMAAAHRLYARTGFVADPARDFEREDIRFSVMVKDLDPG